MTAMRALAITSTILLAACASGDRRTMSNTQIDRVLAGKPGAAQPTKIVATEIAYARTAREEGLHRAMRDFAADDAVIHGRSGPANLKAALSGMNEPNVAPAFKTRAVWMSCDGTTAVSQGRFVESDGKVGGYVTVWELGRNREYRWRYKVTALDNPQPEVPEERAAADGEIVVKGIESLKGIVADCPAPDAPTPGKAGTDILNEEDKVSPDGTLRWRWLHNGAGDRRIAVQLLQGGAMKTVLDETFPPSTGE